MELLVANLALESLLLPVENQMRPQSARAAERLPANVTNGQLSRWTARRCFGRFLLLFRATFGMLVHVDSEAHQRWQRLSADITSERSPPFGVFVSDHLAGLPMLLQLSTAFERLLAVQTNPLELPVDNSPPRIVRRGGCLRILGLSTSVNSFRLLRGFFLFEMVLRGFIVVILVNLGIIRFGEMVIYRRVTRRTEPPVVFLRLDEVQVQEVRNHAPFGQQRADLFLAVLAPAAELADPPQELGTG